MSLRHIDVLEKHVVESGVRKEIKRISTTSSGEAKFHLGTYKDAEKYDEFFNHFDEKNRYYLSRENLKDFLVSVKFEYIYEVFQKYKKISLDYWQQKYNETLELDEQEYFTLEKFTDSRYYIFSKESLFKDYLRSITLPYITNMVINKYIDDSDNSYVFEFNFYLNEQLSTESNLDVEELLNKDEESKLLIGENYIIFGSPGTGKSFHLNVKYKENRRRVTFHPEYSYHDFVGSYKPVPIYKQNTSNDILNNNGEPFSKGEPLIDYRFVPGPFTLSLVDALLNTNSMHTLIIEELNRANAPAVFGDLFQLLDRDADGSSTYSVTNIEIANYLRNIEGIKKDSNNNEINIPNNLNIVATMNSADQGVFIMDSAFKRRWNFEYLPINIDDAEHKNENVPYNNQAISWGDFICQINNKLSSEEIKVNEDKHIGPYFFKPEDLVDKTIEHKQELVASKLLIYLWDDVVRHKRQDFFEKPTTFSDIVRRYKKGERVFGFEFSSTLIDDEVSVEEAEKDE